MRSFQNSLADPKNCDDYSESTTTSVDESNNNAVT